MALGKTTISYSGITLWPDSQVAVTVAPSLATMPAYLPVGNYMITLRVKNGFSSNIIRLFTTTDNAQVPNPALGRLIAQCAIPNGTLTRPVDAECMGTYRVAESGTVRAYFMVDKLLQFVSVTFTKP